MSRVIPFLWFESQAEEAARFYVSVFPDSMLGAITRFPADGRGPEGGVMTVSFSLGGQRLVALNGNQRHQFSPATSLLYLCASSEQAAQLTDLLAQGGEQQPCGWLRDRYGVSWQVLAA
jgi:predicted 3-demethylubiquinone-9 3-methyltransferase (glyoxalase superfamily)